MVVPDERAPSSAFRRSPGDVVLFNSLQGAGAPSGELYALDRTSGKLLWRFRGPSGLQISLGSVRDGILYAPTEADGIYAFRVADGSQVWHVDGSARVLSHDARR